MCKVFAGIFIFYATLTASSSVGVVDVVLSLAVISIAAGFDTMFYKKG